MTVSAQCRGILGGGARTAPPQPDGVALQTTTGERWHRPAERAFLRQLLAGVPAFIVSGVELAAG